MRITQSVRNLTPYVPGEQPKDAHVVKLNTNENPYPPSPACAAVLKKFDLDRLRRYPDPVFTDLRARIAAIWRTTPDRVFVGNGSDEILTLAARAFVEDNEAIGSLCPSYSLYQTLAAIRNVAFTPTPLAADFSWNGRIASRAARTSLFLLTNPNAPTGTCAPVEKIAAAEWDELEEKPGGVLDLYRLDGKFSVLDGDAVVVRGPMDGGTPRAGEEKKEDGFLHCRTSSGHGVSTPENWISRKHRIYGIGTGNCVPGIVKNTCSSRKKASSLTLALVEAAYDIMRSWRRWGET